MKKNSKMQAWNISTDIKEAIYNIYGPYYGFIGEKIKVYILLLFFAPILFSFFKYPALFVTYYILLIAVFLYFLLQIKKGRYDFFYKWNIKKINKNFLMKMDHLIFRKFLNKSFDELVKDKKYLIYYNEVIMGDKVFKKKLFENSKDVIKSGFLLIELPSEENGFQYSGYLFTPEEKDEFFSKENFDNYLKKVFLSLNRYEDQLIKEKNNIKSWGV